MFSTRGDSALVILVPEADAIVGRWRERHDPSAEEGMPAHITVLYPFLPDRELGPVEIDTISDFSRSHYAFRTVFSRMGHFPTVLWVDPGSPECTHLLAQARHCWPQCLPYGRTNIPVIPHLTVTDGADADTEAAAEQDVMARLPLTFDVEALSLMIFDGSRWRERERFSLGQGDHAPDAEISS